MRDNELIALLISTLKPALTVNGLDTVAVVQAYQPTHQGEEVTAAVYIHIVDNRRYGFLERTDKWDKDAGEIVHTETQWYETRVQLSAIVHQTPDLTGLSITASDILAVTASILQSDQGRAALTAQEVGIYRITDTKNTFFKNSRDQFEAQPFIELTLTHKQVVNSVTPAVEKIEFKFKRV